MRLSIVFAVMAVMLPLTTLAHEAAHQFGGVLSGRDWGEMKLYAFGFLGGHAYCGEMSCPLLFIAGPSLFVHAPAVLMLLVALRYRWHPLVILTILAPAWYGGAYALVDAWLGGTAGGDFIQLSSFVPMTVIQTSGAAVFLLCMVALDLATVRLKEKQKKNRGETR